SAAPGPQEAHNPAHALSTLYRRSGDGPWQLLREGLPEPPGVLASVLATNKAEPHVFYAANNRGVFRSADAGLTWEQLAITWPASFTLKRPQALVATSEVSAFSD
ncbi:MAG TPA: glycosyl hydrolase, partial [Ktedonobacteraceae bacterium]|nr:glycosyl hydrolase [Ktedonobacteraceae bacterium]